MSLNNSKLLNIIKVLNDPNTFIEINKSNMELFRKQIVPIIYENQKNFPRDKTQNNNWKKRRIFSLPPEKWMVGVDTGSTYTALVDQSTFNRTIITNITASTNIITIKDSKYINATLYLDNDNKQLIIDNTKKILLGKLK